MEASRSLTGNLVAKTDCFAIFCRPYVAWSSSSDLPGLSSVSGPRNRRTRSALATALSEQRGRHDAALGNWGYRICGSWCTYARGYLAIGFPWRIFVQKATSAYEGGSASTPMSGGPRVSLSAVIDPRRPRSTVLALSQLRRVKVRPPIARQLFCSIRRKYEMRIWHAVRREKCGPVRRESRGGRQRRREMDQRYRRGICPSIPRPKSTRKRRTQHGLHLSSACHEWHITGARVWKRSNEWGKDSSDR